MGGSWGGSWGVLGGAVRGAEGPEDAASLGCVCYDTNLVSTMSTGLCGALRGGRPSALHPRGARPPGGVAVVPRPAWDRWEVKGGVGGSVEGRDEKKGSRSPLFLSLSFYLSLFTPSGI